jgi:hypothetical protein
MSATLEQVVLRLTGGVARRLQPLSGVPNDPAHSRVPAAAGRLYVCGNGQLRIDGSTLVGPLNGLIGFVGRIR